MAWNAIVQETRPQGTQFLSIVSINDGATFFHEGFAHSGTSLSLRRQVVTWIASVETRSTVTAAVGPGHIIDCTPFPSPPGPSPEEVARTQFSNAWRNFCDLDNAVNAGLILASHASYVAARLAITSQWTQSFSNLCVTV